MIERPVICVYIYAYNYYPLLFKILNLNISDIYYSYTANYEVLNSAVN